MGGYYASFFNFNFNCYVCCRLINRSAGNVFPVLQKYKSWACLQRSLSRIAIRRFHSTLLKSNTIYFRTFDRD